jgi:hypothetical protein
MDLNLIFFVGIRHKANSYCFEPSVRIELTTPSLPRKCSTPELRRRLSWQMAICSQQQMVLPIAYCKLLTELSGRPGSNWPPIAWKAIALPNELLPLKLNIEHCTLFIEYSINNVQFSMIKELPPSLELRWVKWAE